MWDSITKAIPVSMGLEMLRSGIEKVVGEPVQVFDMFYINKDDELLFHVTTPTRTIKQPYTGNNKTLILFAIRNLASVSLPKDETLDVVKMHRNEDGTVNLDVYVTNKDGEKICHPIANYKP